MKIKNTVVVMVAFIAIILVAIMPVSALAQGMVESPSAVDSDVPIVPLEIFQKGKASVLSYLGSLVDHVELSFDGRSLVREVKYYLDADDLKSNGYAHKGSFTELFKATEGVTFEAEVIPMKDCDSCKERIDVNINISYKDIENRSVLRGYGGTFQGTDLKGYFNPYVWMPDNILVPVPSGGVSVAKWIGGPFNESREIEIVTDNSGNFYLNLTGSMLGEGIILVESVKGGQNLVGYSLSDGSIINGKTLHEKIGRISSGAVRVLEGVNDFDSGLPSAYMDYGYYFGSVPVIELKSDEPIYRAIDPYVSVWNAKETLRPTRIKVKVLHIRGGFPIQTEFDLNYNPNAGAWIIDLPAGIYQFEYVIPDLENYGNDIFAKG